MNSETAGLQTDFDKEFTPLRLALLLGALMLISYPGIVLGTDAFFYRDAGQFGYPVASYLRDCFWRGEIPLWNPYNNCGIPFLAQWNTLALYPPSLFYILLPMPWSMNYFILGHEFLAALGMYFLARRWFGSRLGAAVAGLAFAWNGLAINCWTWPCHIAALAWMPWVVLLCERARSGENRAMFWASLAGACQMVTGSPELIVFTWLIVGGALIAGTVRQRKLFLTGVARLSLIVLLVTALSAAQLLPWLDFLAHGDRTGASGDAWALPAWGVANFLVPMFRLTGSLSGVFMQAEQQWTSSYYVGIVTLLLALLALVKARNARTVFLGILAVGGVLCAMGDAGVLLKIIKMAVPALGLTRYPIKFVVVTVFALPLLAAAGAAWIQSQPAATTRPAVIGSAAAIAVCAGVVLAAAFFLPYSKDTWSIAWPNGLERIAFLAAGGIAIFWRRSFISMAVLLVVMGLDVCWHEPQQNPTVDVSSYSTRSPTIAPIPRLGTSRVMLGPEVEAIMGNLVNPDPTTFFAGQRGMLFSDLNLLERIPKVNGFFSLHFPEQAAVNKVLYSGKPAPGLEEFLGVSRIANHLFEWTIRTNFMPMASIGQQPVFADDATTLAALGSADFAPRAQVYLPTELRTQISAQADAGAKILSSHVTAEECLFETQANARTMLVIAQAYYHCWTATVDGVNAPLLRANYGFQTVEVPAGKHEVRLIYKDRRFEIGSVVSAAALLLCAAGLVISRKRN